MMDEINEVRRLLEAANAKLAQVHLRGGSSEAYMAQDASNHICVANDKLIRLERMIDERLAETNIGIDL